MRIISLFFVIVLFGLTSCKKKEENLPITSIAIDYKEEMRQFVIGISDYAKAHKTNFNIIPQNGIELVSKNGTSTGQPHLTYLQAIDGNGQEDLFYGYTNDNEKTDTLTSNYLIPFLELSKTHGNIILTTDYCSSPTKMDNSYALNASYGFISFAAPERGVNAIPSYPSPIPNENNLLIDSLSQIKNFLYLINLENFTSKAAFIQAVTSTNYDLLLVDAFFNDGSIFTASEINQLKNKANGGKRLVISYLSIGEAEDYRYYWSTTWNTNKPEWLDAENPNWAGNYKVKYWNKDWQNIIYGNDSSYLKKIISAGFDGVYLDIIDAFDYYEE